ncbi:MAG: ATP-binding cassette domain-containing protein [Opitutaceae bacterium]|jgi:phospholipid/cholesterol/gamma-HCH transport system ATP-binding protein|nr:ATP-binding cassette domain-containing protein [Opitutaceae bacterium]
MSFSDTPPAAAPAGAPLLETRGLQKHFGARAVLADVSLAVPRGRVLAVVGKSGTGKSVLLKCLAGVLAPDAGEVRFDGAPLSRRDPAALAAFRARCSYLFQGNALLDSLNAWENVALPLEQATLLPKPEIRARVADALRRLELEGDALRYPSQLSGGMQKRLALARALVTRPELVLFDEPTAGLDPVRRNAVFTLIAHARREFGFTAIVVTHDLPEALASCDAVALLDHGRIHFSGTPADFAASADPVVAAFRDSPAALARSIAAIRAGETVHDAEDLG